MFHHCDCLKLLFDKMAGPDLPVDWARTGPVHCSLYLLESVWAMLGPSTDAAIPADEATAAIPTWAS